MHAPAFDVAEFDEAAAGIAHVGVVSDALARCRSAAEIGAGA